MITNRCGLVSELFLKLIMAASLTITFDENKYHLMLQEKQNMCTQKRSASCRSIISLSNSLNTGSTSTPQTIVSGSLGPFSLLIEETALAKKQNTASGHVTASTPKAAIKKPKADGAPAKPQPARNLVYSKSRSPRPSRKQKRSRASTTLAYLAPFKENRFYPLSLTWRRIDPPSTKQQNQLSMSWLAPTSAKSNRATQGPYRNLLMPILLRLNPSSQQELNLKDSKPHSDKQRTMSGSCPRLARAQPELTKAQIAHRIRRLTTYWQKRLKKQGTQHPTLQASKKWVNKERPDQVATVHMVRKTKRCQRSATKNLCQTIGDSQRH